MRAHEAQLFCARGPLVLWSWPADQTMRESASAKRQRRVNSAHSLHRAGAAGCLPTPDIARGWANVSDGPFSTATTWSLLGIQFGSNIPTQICARSGRPCPHCSSQMSIIGVRTAICRFEPTVESDPQGSMTTTDHRSGPKWRSNTGAVQGIRNFCEPTTSAAGKGDR
jgi:hypothetical protein